MEKKLLTIKLFKIIDKELIIISNEQQEFYLDCINGSVLTEILTCEGKSVGINYLDIGDTVKIKYSNINPNKIIIKKIYIKTKYNFNSESSEDLELF
tara:strand:- start:1130 stop:1420 length:291 start_codon:yes stop_codon:yes gene_type:complete